MLQRFIFNGFAVELDLGCVCITKQNVYPEDFNQAMRAAAEIKSYFKRTKPGCDWGTDGMGYEANRSVGLVQLFRSGVAFKDYQLGIKKLEASAQHKCFVEER